MGKPLPSPAAASDAIGHSKRVPVPRTRSRARESRTLATAAVRAAALRLVSALLVVNRPRTIAGLHATRPSVVEECADLLLVGLHHRSRDCLTTPNLRASCVSWCRNMRDDQHHLNSHDGGNPDDSPPNMTHCSLSLDSTRSTRPGIASQWRARRVPLHSCQRMICRRICGLGFGCLYRSSNTLLPGVKVLNRRSGNFLLGVKGEYRSPWYRSVFFFSTPLSTHSSNRRDPRSFRQEP